MHVIDGTVGPIHLGGIPQGMADHREPVRFPGRGEGSGPLQDAIHPERHGMGTVVVGAHHVIPRTGRGTEAGYHGSAGAGAVAAALRKGEFASGQLQVEGADARSTGGDIRAADAGKGLVIAGDGVQVDPGRYRVALAGIDRSSFNVHSGPGAAIEAQRVRTHFASRPGGMAGERAWWGVGKEVGHLRASPFVKLEVGSRHRRQCHDLLAIQDTGIHTYVIDRAVDEVDIGPVPLGTTDCGVPGGLPGRGEGSGPLQDAVHPERHGMGTVVVGAYHVIPRASRDTETADPGVAGRGGVAAALRKPEFPRIELQIEGADVVAVDTGNGLVVAGDGVQVDPGSHRVALAGIDRGRGHVYPAVGGAVQAHRIGSDHAGGPRCPGLERSVIPVVGSVWSVCPCTLIKGPIGPILLRLRDTRTVVSSAVGGGGRGDAVAKEIEATVIGDQGPGTQFG